MSMNRIGISGRQSWMVRLSRSKCLSREAIRQFSTSRIIQTSSNPSVPQLTLYTGTDCQLCDVAKEVLEKVAKESHFDLHLYNIRDDSLPDIAKWRRAYQYDIPVLHLNGKEIARHRLNKESVLDQIKRATNQN